jgi:hydrogenase maturation protease
MEPGNDLSIRTVAAFVHSSISTGSDRVLEFTNTKGLAVSAKTRTIAVVGIGNSLLTDDGVGIHALERFAENNTNNDVICIDGGTVGLALLDRLSGLDGLVALDAMKLGQRAGTVTVLEGEAMDEHLRNQHGSVHEVGLSDLLDALRLRGDLPDRRALVGVEPAEMDWGTWPTLAVAAALPEVTAEARRLVRKWRTQLATEAVA